MSEGNGNTPGPIEAMEEAAKIQAMAMALATRFGLDTADGKLAERPILMLVFMVENLLDRVELLEEISDIKQKGPEGGVLLLKD